MISARVDGLLRNAPLMAEVTQTLPGMMELRRSEGGIRAWAAEPGEYWHQTDGAYGGLWRRNRRPPQMLAGVGFSGGKYRSLDEPGLTRAAADKASASIALRSWAETFSNRRTLTETNFFLASIRQVPATTPSTSTMAGIRPFLLAISGA